LDKHGIKSRVPLDVVRDENLPKVCRDLAAQTREHYNQADAFMNKCNKNAMRPARIMRFYYSAVFDQLVKKDWRDPMNRVSLPKWRKFYLMFKGLFL
jgi:phytoene/squalene synthetase